ncbi:hypothetical protein E2C01_093764 [Portunus trituberculatus]|uniref:Uncharacterized protein n=1 Tax=Portunus trituberculatus TaxID=210409 RepID=A0A5B7JV26_PORTR|nr:hypothetical protein [Portunus trituberculatus]
MGFCEGEVGAYSTLQELESVQRAYTRKIRGMNELNYWQRLQRLILEEQVPHRTIIIKNSKCSGRSCERCALPSSTPGRVKTLLTYSLSYSGPRLFNALPKNVRDTTGCPVSRFKKALDHFLQTLPDEPPIP